MRNYTLSIQFNLAWLISENGFEYFRFGIHGLIIFFKMTDAKQMYDMLLNTVYFYQDCLIERNVPKVVGGNKYNLFL